MIYLNHPQKPTTNYDYKKRYILKPQRLPPDIITALWLQIHLDTLSYRTIHNKMDLDPCKYCTYIGKTKGETSLHTHLTHPGMNCFNYHCWTCRISFKKESTMKRHNTTVRHLLEAKKFKDSLANMTSHLWDITPQKERYLTFIDTIDEAQIQPNPEKFFRTDPPYHNNAEPIEIPLEKIGRTKDPRPGVGVYKKIKPRVFDKEISSTYPPADTPDNPPFLIEEEDGTITHVPDKVANQLMDNLIEFLDNYPDAKLVVADEKNHQSPTDEEIPPVSPKISFPDEDLVDIITDESWTILDTVGETPAPEDVFPITHEDFTDFLY